MPVSTASGIATTATPTSNQLKIDMRDEIAMLDVDDTQFTTMLMKLPSEAATSFKTEWFEDQYVPGLSALSASVASTDTTYSLTTNEGAYFIAGDLLINAQTLEVALITTAGASSATVTRGIGAVAAASSPSGAQIVRVGRTNQQGATSPTRLITKTSVAYNYTQIQRHAWGFTETAEATEFYGGRLFERERMKKAIEHKSDIERTLFWGARSYNATGPRTSCGGLIEYVTTNVTNAGGTFDKAEIQDFLRTGLQYGSSNKVLFCAPLVAQVISNFLQDNWVKTGRDERLWGVKVNGVISGVYGTEIPVIVKRQWGNYATASTQFGGYGFLVDLDNVQYAPLRPTRLVMNTQANDEDSVAGEFKTEHSLKVEQEKTHAIVKNVTG